VAVLTWRSGLGVSLGLEDTAPDRQENSSGDRRWAGPTTGPIATHLGRELVPGAASWYLGRYKGGRNSAPGIRSPVSSSPAAIKA
jgi:hypothetical protein